jgi:hypothetical protein
MKKILGLAFTFILLINSSNAQTKRYSFNYPSGKDSTGKIIYKQGLTDAFGKLAVYPFYDWLSWDSELNLALGTFTDKNKKQFYGYIDSTGAIVIPFKYEYLGWFNNDLIARHYSIIPLNNGYSLGYYGTDNGLTQKKFGFIKINGTEFLNNITTPGFGGIEPEYSEGLVPLGKTVMSILTSLGSDAEKKKRYDQVSSYGNYQYIYHDIYGKPYLKGINNSNEDSLMFISAKPFYKGLAAVKYPGASWKKEEQFKRKNNYCLIDKSGKIIIPPKYYEVDNFYEGNPRVSIYDTIAKRVFYGLIDSNGKEVVVPKYVNIENYYKDYAVVAIEVDQVSKKVLWGIVDKKTGKEIIPCKYEAIDGVFEGMISAKQGGLWGFINLKGEWVISPKYIKDGYKKIKFKEGLAVVTTDTSINKKYGVIDKTGKIVIPFIYNQLEDFQEGLAAANKGKILKRGRYSWQIETVSAGKTGYINKAGKTIVPFEYDGGGFFEKGFAIVNKDSLNFTIDINGKNTLSTSPRALFAYNTGLIELNNKNYKSALPYLKEASAGGIFEADYSIGLMYYAGTDVTPKNISEAFNKWNSAALKNSPNAQYGLGLLYAKGEGVASNTSEAINWFTKAASLNHPDALCDLGVLNETGQMGLSINLVESIKFYSKAASMGNPRGMYLLGLAYYNGKGVTKNLQICRTWLEKASAKNYKPAQDALKQYGGMLK